MRTRRLIVLISGVLILTALLPVSLSVWMAHQHASRQFTDELQRFSDRVILRTEKVATQAEEALQQLETLQMIPCSDAHLLEMRRISYSRRYIQEILYLNQGQPVCSSFEGMNTSGTFPAPLTLTPKGYRFWYTAKSDLGIHRNMAALGSSHYVIMIDPDALIDVIPYGPWPINVALIGVKNNLLIASSAPLANEVWTQAARTGQTSFSHGNTMYHVSRYPELNIAILTWASLTPLDNDWRHQLLYWLPFGGIVSVVAAWLIMRILRRLQSPRQRLLDAIRARDIIVYYQPIIALEDGRLAGAEALARWPQPDGTFLAPDIFIHLAEQTGLMAPLTELIVDRVFTDLGAWLQQHPDCHISINIAASDLLSPSLPARLARHIAHWQLRPAQIALELTERSFTDPAMSAPVIARYRQAGHAIYIDDFGTGFSSLSYLQNIEADLLKIDKSFIEALEYNNVTPHIIKMARTLHLEMVAEGIETAQQESWFREHGVQYGQGWFYSKALDKLSFIAWASRR
ncbi:hypothetical protein CHU32_07750 [Superficieibacter electus]|uniref:cyclic-guanylate-specific phosphodiesterase n=1 Tax=Superficieibacter electus TaxID=2022662 RepID=A0A2P5GSJ4_9ENTR|nr:EAL domain-containing protein [Superficieibacter electus]POP46799.1 hypothetical protein CHU33_04795 [Superficieibacter electus]POP49537.1 hypothetical protein CHU32_07750 [Superficieibacter electus]